MEERVFYKPAMRAGNSFQLFMPKDIALGLGIKDRDELEIKVRKTGRTVPKTTRFKKKEVDASTENKKEGSDDAPVLVPTVTSVDV